MPLKRHPVLLLLEVIRIKRRLTLRGLLISTLRRLTLQRLTLRGLLISTLRRLLISAIHLRTRCRLRQLNADMT